MSRFHEQIASLVHVRTLLLQPFYGCPPVRDLEAFLSSFKDLQLESGASGSDSALWHLNNVVSGFDAFKELTEKQTKSPGEFFFACLIC